LRSARCAVPTAARKTPHRSNTSFACLPSNQRADMTVCSSGAAGWRWRVTSARRRASRSRRSLGVSSARLRRSRLTSTTHPTLTKDRRIARRSDSSGRLLVLHGRRSASRSSALAATARGPGSRLPDLSGCGSLERRYSGPRYCPYFVEPEAGDSGRALGRELDLGGSGRAIVGVRCLTLARLGGHELAPAGRREDGETIVLLSAIGPIEACRKDHAARVRSARS